MAPGTTTGTVSVSIPTAGKDCFTWYKVVGNLKSGVTPLIAVHGGPGLSHDYLLCLSDIYSRFGVPVIFYDQVGTGLSTHLPEKNGDQTFWTVDLFIDELVNLAKSLSLDKTGYDVLGHSWGGM